MRRPRGFDDAGRAGRREQGPGEQGRSEQGRSESDPGENGTGTALRSRAEPGPPAQTDAREETDGADPGAVASGGRDPGESSPGEGESGGTGGRAGRGRRWGREPSVRSALRAARRERRRLERREVRRFTRRTRHRRALLLGVAGAVAAVVAASILVTVSPLMAVRTIEVSGTHRLSASQVEHAVAGQLGRPLALVDRTAVRRDLGRIRMIRSYSLVSEPPSTLKIRIVERVPVAAVKTSGGYAVVDAAGVTIETSRAKPKAYPVVSSAVGSPGFASAASVLQALPASTAKKVATVSASGDADVSFTLRGSTAKVVWGDSSSSALKAVILTRLLAAVPHASLYDVSSPRDVVTR